MKFEYDLIPNSESGECAAARVKIARRLRKIGVMPKPGYKTFDLIALMLLPGVRALLKEAQ